MRRQLDIFIVENHEDTLVYLRKYLEQNGHSVRCAYSMSSAITELNTRPAQVLLSDIGLADGSGWDLLRNLKEKPFAVAMSGYGTEADIEKSKAVGYQHHIIKPFLPEELDEVLDSIPDILALA